MNKGNQYSSPWDDKQITILRECHGEGLSFSQIAAEINRRTGSSYSRNACIGKALRIGLTAANPRKMLKGASARYRRPRALTTRVVGQARIHGTPASEREIDPVRGGFAPDFGVLARYDQQEQPDTFLGIPFLDLKENHCRYPKGDGASMLFCGQPKIRGSSYCEACHASCYTAHRTLDISEAERIRRVLQARKNNARRAAA